MSTDAIRKITVPWAHMQRSAQRLHLFASKGPAYHYTYGRWQAKRWLSGWLPRTSELTDATLFAELDWTRPGLQRLRAARREHQATPAARKLEGGSSP